MQTNNSTNELAHWGIKGMQWGVRRFQRKDGSLTPEGKKRYDNDSEGEERDLIAEKKARVLNTHSAEVLYKNKDLFDDKELMNAYLRLNTEKNIKGLIPDKVSKGQKFIDSYTKSSKNIKSVMDSSMDLYKSYEKGKELLDKLTAAAKK